MGAYNDLVVSIGSYNISVDSFNIGGIIVNELAKTPTTYTFNISGIIPSNPQTFTIVNTSTRAVLGSGSNYILTTTSGYTINSLSPGTYTLTINIGSFIINIPQFTLHAEVPVVTTTSGGVYIRVPYILFPPNTPTTDTCWIAGGLDADIVQSTTVGVISTGNGVLISSSWDGTPLPSGRYTNVGVTDNLRDSRLAHYSIAIPDFTVTSPSATPPPPPPPPPPSPVPVLTGCTVM